MVEWSLRYRGSWEGMKKLCDTRFGVVRLCICLEGLETLPCWKKNWTKDWPLWTTTHLYAKWPECATTALVEISYQVWLREYIHKRNSEPSGKCIESETMHLFGVASSDKSTWKDSNFTAWWWWVQRGRGFYRTKHNDGTMIWGILFW